MNGKGLFLLTILITAGSVLGAQEAFRTMGIMSWEWNDGESSDMDDNEESLFWGLESEYLDSKRGFGLDVMADFDTDSQERSILDWRGQAFMRYHFFGGHDFLDPFIEGGMGNAGSVRLADGEELRMSLYPYLSAGGNLLFEEGFTAGARWSWRLDEWGIPGEEIPLAEIGRSQMSLFMGWSYGWRAPARPSRHYHYHFE